MFGDKLVKPVVLDADYSDDLYLPSPNQLKYKILIKNKKLQPSQSSKQRVFELFMPFLFCLASCSFSVLVLLIKRQQGLQSVESPVTTTAQSSLTGTGLNWNNL